MTGAAGASAPLGGRASPPAAGRLVWVASYAIACSLLTAFHPWKALAPDLWAAVPPGQPAPVAPAASHGGDDLWQPMAGLVPPGYDLSQHFVTTEDGYVLRQFLLTSSTRGAGSANSTGSSSSNSSTCSCGRGAAAVAGGRPAVLLQHALMDSSAGWLLLGRGRALALQLADAGFDVWMGNSRGNRYSRNHTRLDPQGAPFWRFTWEDMARHDLPAMVGHALAASGQKSLVYIGYSQGTTIGLAALSTQPALAARLSLAIMLAPVAVVANVRSTPFVLGTKVYADQLAETALGFAEWGAFSPGTAARVSSLCAKSLPLWACSAGLEALCGANPQGNLASDVLSLLYLHLPCGTSVRNMQLWAQNIRRGCSRHMYGYDHGADCAARPDGAPRTCNQAAYGGASEPLAYNFSRISTPIALFSGGADTLSAEADVDLLAAQLAPGVLAARHHAPNYAHLDWELGLDAAHQVYPRIVDLARRYS